MRIYPTPSPESTLLIPFASGFREDTRLRGTDAMSTAKKKKRLFDDPWNRFCTYLAQGAATVLCVFPPLKSTVGGVLAICEIVDRLKSNQDEARALAQRSLEILEVLAVAIPDPTNISKDMLDRILRFEALLTEIHDTMKLLSTQKGIARLLRLNRNESQLALFQRMLDEASQSFMLGSLVRSEIYLTNMHKELVVTVSNVHTEKQELATRMLKDSTDTNNRTHFIVNYVFIKSLFFYPDPKVFRKGELMEAIYHTMISAHPWIVGFHTSRRYLQA
ncbi:hypothetical protein FPV67DRAFT_1670052 [Lyophyllum atratum]|nr:hypothetical protein FPV67DRAFT_1670052 [Lyophyllum atratum]